MEYDFSCSYTVQLIFAFDLLYVIIYFSVWIVENNEECCHLSGGEVNEGDLGFLSLDILPFFLLQLHDFCC